MFHWSWIPHKALQQNRMYHWNCVMKMLIGKYTQKKRNRQNLWVCLFHKNKIKLVKKIKINTQERQVRFFMFKYLKGEDQYVLDFHNLNFARVLSKLPSSCGHFKRIYCKKKSSYFNYLLWWMNLAKQKYKSFEEDVDLLCNTFKITNYFVK